MFPNKATLTLLVLPMLCLAQIAGNGTPPEAFEVASVKPLGPVDSATLALYGSGCDGSFPRVENRRFTVSTTVFALITWAYGFNDRGGCAYVTNAKLISGGPPWIRSERFEIQALIPAGSPTYTLVEFLNGKAPQLEAMLRTLLTERFHLTLRRERKEVQVLALTAPKGASLLTPWREGDPFTLRITNQLNENGQVSLRLIASNATITQLGMFISMLVREPVVDQTGLDGKFNFQMDFAPINDIPNADTSRPSIYTSLQEMLGLKLGSTKAPLEGLVMESAERPSEN
jgi:uncharacterized protein (TIGR03435 family)